MFSFRRWLDRKRDRRPMIRISRGSYRRRRGWRPRVWLAIGLIVCVLAARITFGAWQPNAPDSRIVRIWVTQGGPHRLDGEPVTLAELEQRLTALKADTPKVAVVLDDPISTDSAVAALLARLEMPWLSAADTPPSSAQPEHQGGDHGR